ncbi:hypothetical protein ACJX0J_028163, partial [Zea mays]
HSHLGHALVCFSFQALGFTFTRMMTYIKIHEASTVSLGRYSVEYDMLEDQDIQDPNNIGPQVVDHLHEEDAHKIETVGNGSRLEIYHGMHYIALILLISGILAQKLMNLSQKWLHGMIFAKEINIDKIQMQELLLGSFIFFVSIITWHEILYKINLIGKELHLKDVLIDIAINHTMKQETLNGLAMINIFAHVALIFSLFLSAYPHDPYFVVLNLSNHSLNLDGVRTFRDLVVDTRLTKVLKGQANTRKGRARELDMHMWGFKIVEAVTRFADMEDKNKTLNKFYQRRAIEK